MFFAVNCLKADDIESIRNGDWSDDDTWSNGDVPSTNDVVTINHDIILDVSVTTKTSISVSFGASLTSTTSSLEVKSGATLNVVGSLQVFNLTFYNGSIVNIESTGTVDIENDFTNRNNSDDVIIDGLFNISGDLDNGNGGLIVGTGEICTSGSYAGAGTTFGRIPSSEIAAGSCIRMSIMPIELVNFSAELSNEDVFVNWTTASEKNNNYFELFRSENGVDFISLTRIGGAGNSSSSLEYSYTDMSVPSATLYYMLKQVDYNGDYEIFDLISVSNEKLGNNCNLSVNPNPCVGKCEIVFDDCMDDEMKNASFMVYDATGHVVYTSLNKTIEQGKASFSFNVNNNLKPAVYIVRGSTESKILDKKTILQKNE